MAAPFTTEAERDEFIRRSHVSPDRVAAFYADYLDGRRKCAAVEALFELSNRLERKPDEWDDQHGFGFNVVIHKGPFVEESSFAPYRAWQFALAGERYLMTRIEDALRAARPPESGQVLRNWRSILSASDEMRGMLGDPRHAAIIVTGPLHEKWLLDFTRQPNTKPDWEVPPDLNRTWVIGLHRGALVVHIHDSVSPSLFVIDSARLGRLVEFGRVQYHVDEITADQAEEMLRSRNEEPSPEKVSELTIRVWLRLYESWVLEILERDAFRMRELQPAQSSPEGLPDERP